MALLPDQKSCGRFDTSHCASTVRVWQFGNSDTYFVAFVGERLNAGLSLELVSTNLENFYEEIFQNVTNDPVLKNSDIAYASIDDLIVDLGYEGKNVATLC